MIKLPQKFKEKMKELLGEEYDAFLSCYNEPHYRGIRLNPMKCNLETLKETLPFSIMPAPFSPMSYYMPEDAPKIGRLPMHHAGAFYSQEPSAASAVTALDPQPGEMILDLCAAPGGKSTQIASLLNGQGMLWSNEIVKNRANILLSNMERMGVKNAVISSCHPETLCEGLAGFFDKILVDAPCSGEGMFRRDEQAVHDWSQEHVETCAVRQLAILLSAARALKENGILVYSTCTFSKEENEGVVEAFLKQRDDFTLLDRKLHFGRPAFLPQARRIFPMDKGEGHFVAVLQRQSGNEEYPGPYSPRDISSNKEAEEFFSRIYSIKPQGRVEQIGKHLLLLPELLPEVKGLGVIRAGLLLGEVKSNRIEPAHAAFMAAKPEELCSVINLPHDSAEIFAFLRGEEIAASPSCKGYTGVAVDGVLTGFGKGSNGRMKNHYPKGLRNNE